MPKLGMEPVRRQALIDAAITAIGERGSLDVTTSQIAGIAGVSSALAYHYFCAKGDLLQATIRHLLSKLVVSFQIFSCPSHCHAQRLLSCCPQLRALGASSARET